MRATALIFTGLAIGMAMDGEFSALPFLLSIATACYLRHRHRLPLRRITTLDRQKAGEAEYYSAVYGTGRHTFRRQR